MNNFQERKVEISGCNFSSVLQIHNYADLSVSQKMCMYVYSSKRALVGDKYFTLSFIYQYVVSLRCEQGQMILHPKKSVFQY